MASSHKMLLNYFAVRKSKQTLQIDNFMKAKTFSAQYSLGNKQKHLLQTQKQSIQFSGINFGHKNKLPLTHDTTGKTPILQSKLTNKMLEQGSAVTQKSSIEGIKKSQSILLTNRLTKANYEFRDSSMVDRRSLIAKKPQYNSLSKIKSANSSFIQRFRPVEELQESGLNITEAQIPRINFARPKAKTEFEERSSDSARPKNLKFKLLFKQRPEMRRQTKSERKINRIDEKINLMRSHKRYLTALLPPPPVQPVDDSVKPRGTIVGCERIQKLAMILIKNTELFFNMYIHPKKVGDMFRAVEGYNKDVHKILFSNQFMARRVVDPQQIYKFFWVFRDPSERPEFYGEEDLNLFNVLQNFTMKMDKSFGELKTHFTAFQQKSLRSRHNELQKVYSTYRLKKQTDPKLHEINSFIKRNKIISQQRREENLSKLESLGVRFSVEERSRELIMRERETIIRKISFK